MRHVKITSPSNPLIREIVRLKRKPAGRGEFLVEGPHLVEAASASPGVRIKMVLFTGEFAARREGRQLLRLLQPGTGVPEEGKREPRLLELPEALLSRISDTETPQGIAALVSYHEFRLDEIKFRNVPFLVVCDGIQDPGNLGTIVRVADAAGADAVITLPGTCDPFNQKAIRATAGSLFNIPLVSSGYGSLADYLRSGGIMLCAADIRAERSVYETDLRKPLAIAFGNEAHGVSRPVLEMAEVLVRIPIIGRAESLNVAAAASVCLYEAVRQRKFA